MPETTEKLKATEIFKSLSPNSFEPVCRRGEGFADKILTNGNEISGRAVPYGKTVQLAEGLFEEFLPGTFARQAKDPQRVKICLEHNQVVGKVFELSEKEDGLYFRGAISESKDLPEARRAQAIVDEDLFDELSIGFSTVKGGMEIDDSEGFISVKHSRARLMEISLVPWGAYGRDAILSRSILLDGPWPGTIDLQIQKEDARLRAMQWLSEWRARF